MTSFITPTYYNTHIRTKKMIITNLNEPLLRDRKAIKSIEHGNCTVETWYENHDSINHRYYRVTGLGFNLLFSGNQSLDRIFEHGRSLVHSLSHPSVQLIGKYFDFHSTKGYAMLTRVPLADAVRFKVTGDIYQLAKACETDRRQRAWMVKILEKAIIF